MVDITPTITVSVTGSAQEGQILSAKPVVTTDTDGGITKYQWQRLVGQNWVNIAGATHASKLLNEADEGFNVRVMATFTDDTGQSVTAISVQSATVTEPPPKLTLGTTSLTVAAGGSVALPIIVASFDADDTVSMKITGLPTFESITDNLDHQTFTGSSIVLTAAQVNSGLTLNSTYTGTDHPVNVLTVTATNSTVGEVVTSAAQTITVTDPPGALSTPHTFGSTSNDTLRGGATNDKLVGNGGYDTYQFARQGGQDVVVNGALGQRKPSGELDFGPGISQNQLWLERQGRNLVIDIMGSSDRVTVQDWFANSGAQLQQIKTSHSSVLNSQVSRLVQAMASYEHNHLGFNPTASGVTQMPTDPTLQHVLAAAWHR